MNIIERERVCFLVKLFKYKSEYFKGEKSYIRNIQTKLAKRFYLLIGVHSL